MADTAMSRREYKTGSVYKRSSDGRWFGSIDAGVTADGTRRRRTVSAKTKPEVLRRLRDLKLEQERAGEARNVKRTTTVARWSATWLTMIRPNVRPSSYQTDLAAVGWINQAIGSLNLTELTPGDVRSVAAKIRSGGNSSSTALRYHGSLMRMLTAAARDGYVVPSNVMLATKPKKSVNDREAIPLEKSIPLLGHVATLTDGSRFATALLQGHRQGESLGLTWPEVDLDAGTLTISWQVQTLRYRDRADPTQGFHIPDDYEAIQIAGATHLVRPKSDAGWRVQPLVPWAVSAFRQWREIAPKNQHQLVWPGRTIKGVTWPRNAASDRAEWYAIQKDVGVAHPAGRPYFVHEARHATATLLMALGVPESVRVQIMGHSTIASTRAYEHVDISAARGALEKAAARLGLLPSEEDLAEPRVEIGPVAGVESTQPDV